MTRCTCVYRTAHLAEKDEGIGPLVRIVRDPFCPADEIHTRKEVSR